VPFLLSYTLSIVECYSSRHFELQRFQDELFELSINHASMCFAANRDYYARCNPSDISCTTPPNMYRHSISFRSHLDLLKCQVEGKRFSRIGFHSKMNFRYLFVLIATIYLPLVLANPIDEFRQRCLCFAPEQYIHNSTRTVLSYVPANTTLLFPDNDATCARPNQTVSVDICRIALSIPTSNRSSITFEMWLPRNWTGRFLGTGNGGIDGCL
jgi:hypothetical protein